MKIWILGKNQTQVAPVGLKYAEYTNFISTKLNNSIGFVANRTETAFKHLKNYLGTKTGWERHHLVEQHSYNLSQFGMKNIHNTKNVVQLPTSVHNAISVYYTKAYTDIISGIRYSHYRDYVKTLNFDKQYEIGLKVIRDLGYGNYIK